MAEQPLRIGIVGAGGIVRQRHMPGLAPISGVEVVAVANRRRGSAEAFAAEFGVAQVYDDWKALVADPDIDVVWIGTTPYMHARISVAALEAGKHVFCQARMARNVVEARTMVAAAHRRPDLTAVLCPPPLGMAGEVTMHRLLGTKRFVGSVRQVRLSVLDGSLAGGSDELHWRQDFDVSGYNTLTVGIYAEVLQRWVGRARSLQAHTGLHVRTRRDPSTGEYVPVQVPDSVSVVGELASGADFVYQWSGVANFAPPSELWIFGDQGTLVYTFGAPSADGADAIRGAKSEDGELAPIEIPDSERGSWQVEADFIRAIREGGAAGLAPDFDRGLDYMEFLEAAMRSARDGVRVGLPLN